MTSASWRANSWSLPPDRQPCWATASPTGAASSSRRGRDLCGDHSELLDLCRCEPREQQLGQLASEAHRVRLAELLAQLVARTTGREHVGAAASARHVRKIVRRYVYDPARRAEIGAAGGDQGASRGPARLCRKPRDRRRAQPDRGEPVGLAGGRRCGARRDRSPGAAAPGAISVLGLRAHRRWRCRNG